MPTPTSDHVPVLLSEVLSALQLRTNQDAIDATLGGGGHTRAILNATGPEGRLLAIEADPRTLAATQAQLAEVAGRITFVNANFRSLQQQAEQHGFSAVAGILIDLGLSTIALEDASRGFSFQLDGPLDMRFDPNAHRTTAAEIVNRWSAPELARIFSAFGEERKAQRIAETIIGSRAHKPIDTTSRLADLVASVKPRRGRIHPATQVFQALRMAVNDELGALHDVLPQAVNLLRPGGRLAIITFHSIEDREVKRWTKETAKAGSVRLVNAHVIQPNRAEVLTNPRARSAKLRIIEKN